MTWTIEKDLDVIRGNFPILEKCVYLISNSLGAVPQTAALELERYYKLWAEWGVEAWEKEWWEMARKVGDSIAVLLNAPPDTVTMMPNATTAQWMALSSRFRDDGGNRKKVVVSEKDFPSTIYAIRSIAETMGWTVNMIPGSSHSFVDSDEIIQHLDDETLIVSTSHVFFKSAAIQDVKSICRKAREVGALSIIDGYHAPGVIEVDVQDIGTDFYIGGCLKWLCGGPGNAFLYVRPGLSSEVEPGLTGWFAHKDPFNFSTDMEYMHGSYRFMSGTPCIPCFYTAKAGLEIIHNIGIDQIRKNSLFLTDKIFDEALARGYGIYTPEDKEKRAGAVSIDVPHGGAVQQVLSQRKYIVDFRKGGIKEPDTIRVAPHFYNRPEEIKMFFSEIDDIVASGAYKEASPDGE
ncbi:MAG: aminotransferase class V-fold PLP-dependent enzyme [Candidatus Aminicenantes bacterium]|nr:aminotransferase class V-fold PLP-dependent enzyme [Candidatus Aminicenantes bacterium]